MKRTLDLTAYFPAKGGNKAFYRKVGNLFIDDADGRISAKLDSVPVGSGWEGWLNAFEVRDKPPLVTGPNAVRQSGVHPDADDIPF